MVAYADTSFLFSLYAQDTNTVQAGRTAAAVNAPFILTPLQQHELRNAFRLSVFRGAITAGECQGLIDTLESDIKNGVLCNTPVAWAEVYAEAEALSAAHTGRLGLRASDVLHVASAMALGAREFYTFDVRQKALAVKVGLKVRP
ncbi:MAG: type II toxin-antitoxin system VapC family toxin [bacterium]